MTSPYSSGGGGTHLEARMAAACLAAILSEASVRGLPGEFATQVRTQRGAFGDPLDDLIIDGLRGDGRPTQLHLQVKNKLTFTANDDEWVEVLRRAWDTFTAARFNPVFQRVGVGIGTYNARADQQYQSVLNWAEHSPDAQNFFERIAQGDYSHQDKQSFVATVRTALEAHAGRALTDDELWRFFKVFVIVHYDFQSAAGSRDEANVIERLKGLLPPEHRDQAKLIWDHLVAKAGEMVPVGGGATRPTLAEQLATDGFTVGAAPSFWKDIEAVQRESRRALDDIKSRIQGLKLHRTEAHQLVREALSEARFIQIDGEPGTGKSALLKDIAEECARNGPVFVLKDSRIHPKGWAAHAHILGLSHDLAALLRELACTGEPILFIDGIDKITDPAVQLTVNDILKAIANDACLAAWRVLATIREQNLKHLETWLDPDTLKQLPLRTIAVKPLDDEELERVARHFPRLRPLLNQPGGPDIILKRPFFLNALLSLADADGQLPATEVELLKLWWELGGTDRKEFASAQHRRNLLIQAAESIAHAPNAPIAIRGFAPEPLEELKSASVLRDKELGHSVAFAHDIYEEWALCELLISQQPQIAALLQKEGEPDALIRPVQLLGAYALETNPSSDAWKALLDATGDPSLRPVWQRAVLTACVQSTRTTQLLEKLTAHLLDNNGERLQKLMRAMATIEVQPNPLFLNEQLTPDLEPEERAKYANLTAVPKPLTWVRFLDWLMPQVPALRPSLIADLLPVFKTWQDAFAGRQVRHCREIGQISYAWLKEIEEASRPENWQDHRSPFGGVHIGRDAEKSIRALFLASAGDVPSLASEYLRAKASDKHHVHMVRGEIVKNCGKLITHVPVNFVDFILTVFLEDPDGHPDDPFGSYSDHMFDELGISAHQEFHPPSPIQLPFLFLLRAKEDEGLRLIRGFCNHSMAIWRKGKERGRRYSEPLMPVPITLTFSWGEQTFWGDGQVYLWFRGVWGNDAVQSAMMALEQWALERLEGGVTFDEIFRKVIEGNDSVAALGIGASLCLAYPGVSLDAAFPLVTCPYLWEWEIQRVVQEATPLNEMGNWHQDRMQLNAVRVLNQKPHRKSDIRQLILYFVFCGDAVLLEKFVESIHSFPQRLPISYEEEKNNAEHMAALHEKMALFAEQADPQNLKTAPTADGKHTQIWIEPPSLQKEKYRAQQEAHDQRNQWLSVALWANKSLEKGEINEQLSLADALAKARAWDKSDLFDAQTHPFDDYRAAAVAGTAYVAAKYCPPEAWTDELASWCLDVMERAATGPEVDDRFTIRSAALLMNPAVFAAHGYAALLARSYEVEQCQAGLLSLAVDTLEGVQLAVVASAKDYAADRPEFYWVLLDLMLQQCVVDREEIPNHHSIQWSQSEAERTLALLDRAETALRSNDARVLATIPMPWVKDASAPQRAQRDMAGYVRNDEIFRWDIAGKILPHICLEQVLSVADRRAQLLKLVGEFLELTFQEIVPPFAKSKREHGANTPYEWVFAVSAWCGKLCTHLTLDEARQVILAPIWAQPSDTALLIMQSLMRTFMIRALLTPPEISDEHIALWSEMAEWVFANPEWTRNGGGDYLDREFTSCALTLLFCAAGDFSPLICGIDPGWPHLGKFLPILERAVREFGTNETLYHAVITFLKRGGIDLLPEPALVWLHEVVAVANKKGDQKFWASNGESTVELLKLLISQKSAVLTPEHRKLITSIADILVDDGVRGAGFLQQELMRSS
jgi:hypothetical protein